MNEKISDERLRTLIEKCNSSNWQAPKEHCSYGVGIGELEAMAVELLSLRSLNKRLVEDAITLAHQVKLVNDWELDVVEDATSRYWAEILDQHAALMKEIGGGER